MNSLLAKLAMLMGEYTKLKGVQKEVRFLEFSSMKALLERIADMDERRNQVREMSYDIEDCIDDFLHHLNRNNDHDMRTGFVNKTATTSEEAEALD
ncbi:hypothetical protein E2562_017583 [Oryza meyeriana var. granulata]|uniref:Disease resistance N-terminal domain-containing protein n=1 Tax=Oryza meyeriana var. granulata TaxID=110450 RepID=A0A6G1BMW2_9ORYZ|nr:hypothetical protein E2562_017583 [Oryza meyeriana var. granulata]